MERTSQLVLISTVLLAAVALGVTACKPAPTALTTMPSAAVFDRKVNIEGRHFVRWAKPRPPPLLSFQDADGRRVRLADFKGRVVLLNVWATWCSPCRQEMPALDRLNAERKAAGLEVIAVSLDPPAAARAFLMSIDARTLTAYTDSEGMAMRVLSVSAVPSTILIGRNGRELGRLAGAAVWDSGAALALIDDALKEPL